MERKQIRSAVPEFTLGIALTLSMVSAWAQTAASFNNTLPAEIVTPDTVETRIGTLKYFDGFPTKETTQKVYDHLDFLRGVEVFLSFIPAASIEAVRRGMVEVGATTSNQAVIFDQLLDSTPLFLTGNTDNVYLSAVLDLERDGPTVIEVPSRCGPSAVNDAFFRSVVDMGSSGHDQGKGGKYLILPNGYKGKTPEGFIVARSPSYVNWLILSGFLVDGKPDGSAKLIKEGLKIYPLAMAKNPPSMEYISGSKKRFNTIQSSGFGFYQELAQVIAREPVDFIDPELRGLAASIGIRKDKPFAPDARMVAVLTDAAAVGNATARAIVYQTRDQEAYYYNNSQWKTAVVGGDFRWLIEGGTGGRNMDARTLYFYQASVNTPAMAAKMVDKGLQYAYTEHDKDSNYLDGAKEYRLHLPANVPAKDFWSVVVYDPQTRSELQTSQPFPGKNNKHDDLIVNGDGSIDLYFGPTAPAGKEKNWMQTIPGKGWFTILRLYGPFPRWFDKIWRPGEIELVK